MRYLLIDQDLTAIYDIPVSGAIQITACACGNTNLENVFYDCDLDSLVCNKCDTFIDPIDQ